MIKLARQLLLLLLSLALVSCSSTMPATLIPSVTPTIENGGVTPTQGYPIQNQSESTDSYPAPPEPTKDFIASIPESIMVPQPKDGLGVITGRLVESSSKNPYMAPSLILGTMVFANNPNASPPLLRYSEDTDPKGIQDRSGKFVFTDIQPGTYGIVIWTPGSVTPVNDIQGNTVQVRVEAGKVTDLGEVYIP